MSCAFTRLRSDVNDILVVAMEICHLDSSKDLKAMEYIVDNCNQGTFVKKGKH